MTLARLLKGVKCKNREFTVVTKVILFVPTTQDIETG